MLESWAKCRQFRGLCHAARSLSRMRAVTGSTGGTCRASRGGDSGRRRMHWRGSMKRRCSVPSPAGISTRAGLVVRRRALGKDEVVRRRGLPATCMLRTIRDLCVRLSLTEAVAIADMALHAGKLDRQDLVAAVAAPNQGVRVLRRVLEHAEPGAESPMETRLRMLLVLAGLPRPEAQVPIRDRLLRVIGRPDLYYRDQRLGLEYDGGTHRDTLAEDNRRQNRLLDAGVRLLRFTAVDIFNTPDHVIGLVRAALAA
ncbi:MAG: DUF559 domain-containing protein [Chloroflexi bacterium]|nr:MAG: DUF559 domain-containing protein [Chloroflexota bacterium]